MCFWDFADAFVGGVIGLLFAYICYRQHYPPFLHMDCHLPYASLAATAHAPLHPPDDPQPTDNATTLPLEGLTEGPVWLAASAETPPTPSPNHQAHLPVPSDWLTSHQTVRSHYLMTTVRFPVFTRASFCFYHFNFDIFDQSGLIAAKLKSLLSSVGFCYLMSLAKLLVADNLPLKNAQKNSN